MNVRATLFLMFAVVIAMLLMKRGPYDGPVDQKATVGIERSRATVDLLRFDGSQRTCALFVALRAAALEDPAVFGGDTDGISVHWNTCKTGDMVACAAVPQANGDTLQVGIPWTRQVAGEL